MTRNERTDPRQRRRWSPAHKLRIVEQSQQPNTSVAQVARLHDVNPNTVYRWRHEAKAGNISTTPEGQSRFALVAVADRGDGTATLELVLRNGRILRLSEGTTPSRLALLADALEGGRP
jgi:transposase